MLFVCEDNGIGISTPTPTGWIAASFSQRPGMRYFYCNGLDLIEAHRVATEAAAYVRKHRKPAFLHIQTVRLYGHAGSDVEATYRNTPAIEADEANDPLLHSVRILRDTAACTSEDALEIYQQTEARCTRIAAQAVQRPHLKTAADVVASLIPPKRACSPTNGPSTAERNAAFGSDMRAMKQPQPMNRLINWALTDLMLEHAEIALMGEDVGRKGGVYGVTQKLKNRFGADRVIDTLLDEQSILGLAIGMAHNGFVPMPEIQFLAYLHNAEDQIRGEAATLSFFSNGQFTNPMVLRVAGLGYQRGFGGHFHNDNSLAVLRDIPGVIIVCPSNGADAAKMLRESVRLAREEQRVVVFIEPIALYPMRDLHKEGDQGWMNLYPAADERIELGQVNVSGRGTDLAIVSYANGYFLSLQAAKALKAKGIKVRVIDMRWIAPVPKQELLKQTKSCRSILIVDECRETGSQSEGLVSLFAEIGDKNIARLTATDCFIATGPAYGATLPTVEGIATAALELLGKTP